MQTDFQIRCRKCRHTLVQQVSTNHIAHGSLSTGLQASDNCHSLFIDEDKILVLDTDNCGSSSDPSKLVIDTRTNDEDALLGKLQCPNVKCPAKLGQWSWNGVSCSCGEWISPAFALSRSKIDIIPSKAKPL